MRTVIAAVLLVAIGGVAVLSFRLVALEKRVAAVERTSVPARLAGEVADGSAAEVKERLDFLTGELAAQRGKLERMTEKITTTPEENAP